MPVDHGSKYAPTVWGVEQFNDLEVPSGQMCQVRQPGIQPMIAAGVLDSADTLTHLVNEKHVKRVQGRTKSGPTPARNAVKPSQQQPLEVDGESLVKDPENMGRVLELVDKVTEHMVIQPVLRRPIRILVDDSGKKTELPLPPTEREKDVIYTDQVNLIDKMFIFQYAVGGAPELEQFREQFSEIMGGIPAQRDVESETV